LSVSVGKSADSTEAVWEFFFSFKQPERNIKMYITRTLIPLPMMPILCPDDYMQLHRRLGNAVQAVSAGRKENRFGEQSVNF